MNKSPLKYTIAWDRVTDKFITPDEVNRAEAHDTNRYFSEKFDINEDKGYVLTLHKKSKEYSSKNGKTISRRAHFVRLADNTREYRIETEKKAKAQESVVHKLCKEVIKDISNIKIPNLYANILGEKLLLIPEQIIPIKLISIERKDTTSGTIPDATVETVIFGKKQKLYIEFFYKHEVDEAKRLQFNFYNQNCIEIDLSDLRDNLDLSEKALKKLIKEKIENDCYWISNRAKCLIEKDIMNKYVIDINKTNYLRPSEYYYDKNVGSNEWFSQRLYLFRDNFAHLVKPEHPCYFQEESDRLYMREEKCRDIGQCKNCDNCVYIEGYNEMNDNNIHIYCDREVMGLKGINPTKLISMLINDMIAILDKEET